MSTIQRESVVTERGTRSLTQLLRFLRQPGVPLWIPYVFITPFFIIFAVFMLYPIVDTLVLSFENWSTVQSTWVGIQNYRLVITDPAFWTSLLNDAFILLIQVPFMLFIATLLAVALNARFLKLKWLFRLLIFFPVLVDAVTYTIAFQLIFNPSFGMMNYLLHLVGLPSINWIGNSWAARLAIFLVVTWRWTGYNAIIILSGLQNIPEEVYESAVVDGAGRVRTFFQITLPLLRPVILFCTILSTVGTLQLFTEPYILTGGGPGNATETPMLYLYNIGFQNYNFGLASAGTYILTTIIAILSYFQIRVSRGGDYSA
ncbi:carbohydrate ABC transporter permease [Alicyclobacillus acidocaldarius]|uniref:Binding-protein-dependent transport systems inner membrane component n=1 Tax=Alicyclobacillus acidocaldarius subsp. acidocaldarius (strain ATCC 27009 / DSM 446 / BCRC 14685 / JCM 5260 / KCTC 1825 / NBRC 15652 / NCIMB 11725 / NRRL B-14509 / 104-IA) TaxID=521098 RepID=C8WVX3_ALIAD|nr:sugar ABC transporter permease [Alicyclobacillus acidocaldarius]ACV58245.1 binding-protein-dependent transport systems inner membrane component [Alicyclobacillus acidocaldarius subsp. acidocaldarius DSM 446]